MGQENLQNEVKCELFNKFYEMEFKPDRWWWLKRMFTRNKKNGFINLFLKGRKLNIVPFVSNKEDTSKDASSL
jgi:hypothetical protein